MPTRRRIIATLIGFGSLLLSCAHAPPATGSRAPDAVVNPDYPEQNCAVNNTVDCRPGAH